MRTTFVKNVVSHVLVLVIAFHLSNCNSPRKEDGRVAKKNASRKTTFIVHLPKLSSIPLNFLGHDLTYRHLRFANPGKSDTTVIKTVELDQPTHFSFQSVSSPNGRFTFIQRHLLARPDDTLELRLAEMDLQLEGRSNNRVFLDEVMNIDTRIPSFKFKRYGANMAAYNQAIDSLHKDNSQRINAAYEKHSISVKEKEDFLSFNDFYIASEYLAPLTITSGQTETIVPQMVNFFFAEKKLPIAYNINTQFLPIYLEGFTAYQAFKKGIKANGLVMLNYVPKEALGRLYPTFVVKFLREHPRKSDPALKHFIDSFSTSFAGTIYGRQLDSLKKVYYQLPAASAEQILGKLFDTKGGQTDFRQVVTQHKGKIILVDFWASWCHPCREEMPHLEKIKEKMAGKSVKFLSISIDVDERNEDWKVAAKAEKIWDENSYRLKNGNHNPLLKFYGIGEVPRYMVFGKDGKLLNDNFSKPTSKNFEKELDQLIKER